LEKKISPGGIEKGGYFNFGGRWTEVVNEGVSCLTCLDDTLTKLKVIKCPGGDKYVLLFETWDPKHFVTTSFMTVDCNGKVLSHPQELCHPIRLMKADDPCGNLLV